MTYNVFGGTLNLAQLNQSLMERSSYNIQSIAVWW